MQPWTPPDFDARAAAAAVLAPPRPVATVVTAPGGGWSPPTLEDRRPVSRTVQDERDDAYQRGFDEGRLAGADEARVETAPAVAALGAAVARLHAAEGEFAREREKNLVALALAVAHKLVQQEIETRPEVLQALVARALELLPTGVPAEVRLHPADLEALASGVEALAVEGRAPEVTWVGDPGIARGSFFVDGPTRVVDGRIDIALRRIYERLAT